MRLITTTIIVISLSSCAAHEISVPTARENTDNIGAVSYFDRNSDGLVDFELHDPGCCDRTWALVDQNFDGRYDERVNWGYSLNKRVVDVPVPKNVKITAGDPPLSGWQN